MVTYLSPEKKSTKNLKRKPFKTYKCVCETGPILQYQKLSEMFTR